MSDFGYLIEKIRQAEFASEPFRHLLIEDFLSAEHLQKVTTARQVCVTAENTSSLIDKMLGCGYKIQAFPGCTKSVDDYLSWQKWGTKVGLHGTTETQGMVFRLQEAEPFLGELVEFFCSPELKACLQDKFGVVSSKPLNSGIQKYLDGYEISPHPDVRRKALTYLLNINTDDWADSEDVHTHLLRFVGRYSYIPTYWNNNPEVERCWVPWGWCKTVKVTNKNNSILLFAPSNDTLHAVKLDYSHLRHQRTQVYGNLWYEGKPPVMTHYKDLPDDW